MSTLHTLYIGYLVLHYIQRLQVVLGAIPAGVQVATFVANATLVARHWQHHKCAFILHPSWTGNKYYFKSMIQPEVEHIVTASVVFAQPTVPLSICVYLLKSGCLATS